MQADVAIIGGGLSGLYAAVLLRRSGYSCVLLEARERLGGRVLSVSIDRIAGSAVDSGARYDLGPAWFWPDIQPRMRQLIADLGLEAFPQHTEGGALVERSTRAPPQRIERGFDAEPRSMRLAGGMQALVDGLAGRLPVGSVYLGATVTAVHLESEQSVRLEALRREGSLTVTAKAVIVALPPRLVAETISFFPELPSEFHASLGTIPTWMASHAKMAAIYERPFWRAQGLSGTATSILGPLAEIHDASAPDGHPALFGFLGVAANDRRQIGAEELKALCLAQLVRLFGSDAAHPLAVFLTDWAQERFTATSADAASPTAHPYYRPLRGLSALWAERMAFAGTELAGEFGGYLEGALESAATAVETIRALQPPAVHGQ